VSVGEGDSFISKFDQVGNWIWSRTFGGAGNDRGLGIAVDGAGNAYGTGAFSLDVDFDPGIDEDMHSSNGFMDIYLVKYDPSGMFQWAKTWGGAAEGLYFDDYGNGIDADENYIVVTGLFCDNNVDFDPGPDTDIYPTVGHEDIFLSKFDTSGAHIWTRTWGGIQYDGSWGVGLDSGGNVLVNGWFQDTVDFDPGSGTDLHTAEGMRWTCLSRFTGSGDFTWVRTWGGVDDTCGLALCVDPSGCIYSTGFYYDNVDFDPGPGVDIHPCYGGSNAFISKFKPDGSW
jgi:hypothetical protein